jgi:hypothetical protein
MANAARMESTGNHRSRERDSQADGSRKRMQFKMQNAKAKRQNGRRTIQKSETRYQNAELSEEER